MACVTLKAEERTSRQGSFTLESIPTKTFSLGGGVFVSCNTFKKRILVHIRQYKQYGDRFYPSTEGVTFSPAHFSRMLNCEALKTQNYNDSSFVDYFTEVPLKSSNDPISIISDTLLSIQDEYFGDEILFELNDSSVLIKKEMTSRSGSTYTHKLSVNHEQWENLFSIGDTIMTYIVQEKYRDISFKELFELASATVPPDNVPDCPTLEEIEASLHYMLKTSFYDVIAERSGMVNPSHTLDDIVLKNNTVKRFNEAVLDLRPYYVAEAFYKKVCNFPFDPIFNCKMLCFVTQKFLSSISIPHMIQASQEAFCKFSV